MLRIPGKNILKFFWNWWSWTWQTFLFTPSFRLPLTIQLSLNHTIVLVVTMEDRKFKPYMSQGETIGGTNQLGYKAFGRLHRIYISEHSNTLVPKSFSSTSISWYLSIHNRLLLDFCFHWKNTFVDCNIKTKDFVRWCDILRRLQTHIVSDQNLLHKLNQRHIANHKWYH